MAPHRTEPGAAEAADAGRSTESRQVAPEHEHEVNDLIWLAGEKWEFEVRRGTLLEEPYGDARFYDEIMTPLRDELGLVTGRTGWRKAYEELFREELIRRGERVMLEPRRRVGEDPEDEARRRTIEAAITARHLELRRGGRQDKGLGARLIERAPIEEPPKLGAEFRESRRAAGMSLEDLAEVTNSSLSYLSRVENDRQLPTKDKLEAWLANLDLQDSQKRSLVILRDATELVERQGLDYGVALLAVLLNEATNGRGLLAQELQPALERLSRLQLLALSDALRQWERNEEERRAERRAEDHPK